jgi:hypothetical protein
VDRMFVDHSLEYICSIRSCSLEFVLVRLVEEELVHILLVVAVVEERHIHLAVEGNRLERVVVDILLPVALKELVNAQ